MHERSTLTRGLVVASLAASLSPLACTRTDAAGAPAAVPPLGAAAPLTDPAPPAPEQRIPSAVQAEAIPEPPDENHTIAGTIVLPAAHRRLVERGDVIFLAARRAGGPPGPGSMLAVQKLTAGDFPMPFEISSRDAMIPGIPFEGRVSITVRVDKDGDAMTRRKGDLYGQAEDVKVGSHKVVIALDKLQADDQTLGGMGALAGAPLPPGHPAIAR